MKKAIITFIHMTLCFLAIGQTKIDKATSAIVEEGKKLYRSELASWYGTDIFLARFGDRRNDIGGYFSYNDRDLSTCIFYSKSDNPKVIGTISFDATFDLNSAQVSGSERDFTTNELELYSIRNIALKEINSDTFFETYKNTSLNLIPIIEKGFKKVYVLTGPRNEGVVIIGNDYLLSFDKKNNLVKKSRLHKNILPIKYAESSKDAVSMHTHLKETGDFITATDICTLLLYGKLANWKQHIVISEKYVCMWNCETNQLNTLTRKAWDNILKDQEKRKQNQNNQNPQPQP